MSEVTNISSITVTPKAPPVSFTGTCKIKGKYNDSMTSVTITLTTASGDEKTYTFSDNTTSSYVWGASLNLPSSTSPYEINEQNITSDTIVYILWQSN